MRAKFVFEDTHEVAWQENKPAWYNKNRQVKKKSDYRSIGAFAFGYNNNNMILSAEASIHEEIWFTRYGLESKPKANHESGLIRYNLTYPGRIFLEPKIITFYDFPENKSRLLKILHDIENVFIRNKDKEHELTYGDEWREKDIYITSNINDWKIEIITGYNNNKPVTKYININDYKGSNGWSEKVLYKSHTLTPTEKEQLRKKKELGNVPDGIGSKHHKTKSLAWKQSMQSESLHVKNKYKL